MKPASLPALALALLLTLTTAPLGQTAEILGELDSTQKETLKKGSQVVVIEDIKGKPWPRVTIYKLVKATPEEVAAVFFDYEDNKSFVPNLLKSEISKRISPQSSEVDYGVDVPILPDEYYTVRNTITRIAPDQYRIDWKLVRAVQTKDSVGSFRIEPYEDQTLICYQNLVTPGSSMAGLLRKTAISQMKDAATAIAQRAETLKTRNPEQLKKQVEELRAALK